MGNAESAHGTSTGLMIGAIIFAPFTGGASLALAAGSGIAAGTSVVHAINKNTANSHGKKSANEWGNGLLTGLVTGVSKL